MIIISTKVSTLRPVLAVARASRSLTGRNAVGVLTPLPKQNE
jgi:hypothetical protein